MENHMGYVHSLESFGSVDGPGVRYVIFLSGCPMRCQFCHNPDTWEMKKGTLYSADDLLEKALRYRNYWGDKGGITVSGGEPLMQIDFLTELFRKAKEKGVHTTLDTSGAPFTEEGSWFEKWKELMKYTDLVMLISSRSTMSSIRSSQEGRTEHPSDGGSPSDMGKPVRSVKRTGAGEKR